MDINRAKEIVSALAEGVDPTTGEILPEDSVYNKGDVVRALYAVLSVCNQKETVKENGSAIDQMERDIESRCMKLLLHQQPVAKDLRLISAALKIITDMERIGDQAEDIAEIVAFLNGHNMDGMKLLTEMAGETTRMVTSSVDAFVKKDVELAKSVIVQDDIVDDYFSKVKHGIISLIVITTTLATA